VWVVRIRRELMANVRHVSLLRMLAFATGIPSHQQLVMEVNARASTKLANYPTSASMSQETGGGKVVVSEK
jgi:hypothetical protein